MQVDLRSMGDVILMKRHELRLIWLDPLATSVDEAMTGLISIFRILMEMVNGMHDLVTGSIPLTMILR